MVKMIANLIRKALSDQQGQIIPWVAIAMVGLLGMAGMAIDVGHIYAVKIQLQNSTNAAALAGAPSMLMGDNLDNLTHADPTTTVMNYSAAPGGMTANGFLGTVDVKVTPTCLQTIITKVPCEGGAKGDSNGLRVTQVAHVPMTLLSIFGKSSVDVSATAVAVPNLKTQPINVAIILDATTSMNTPDTAADCNGLSQEICAENALQILVRGLDPAKAHLALFSFPNVTVGTASRDYNCTSGTLGFFSTDVSTLPIAAAYTFPAIRTSSPYSYTSSPSQLDTGSGTGSATTASYEIIPFSIDYNTNGVLNSSSNLVKAVGGVSGCAGLAPPNEAPEYGTTYAGAMYAAQAALMEEYYNRLNATPSVTSQNVIILLSDGDATAHGATTSPTIANGKTMLYGITNGGNGVYPSWAGQCGQAVDASTAIQKQGTLVYSIAYGSELYGCTSDQTVVNSTYPKTTDSGYPRPWLSAAGGTSTHLNISPCETMEQIASGPRFFFSDYDAPGGDPSCTSTNSPSLTNIMNSILASFSTAELVPSSMT